MPPLPMTDLAKAAGARIVGTDAESALLLGPDGVETDLDAAERILSRAIDAAERLDRDVSVMAAIETSADWQAAPPQVRRLVMHVVNTTLEHEYSGSAKLLSAWHGQGSEAFDGEDMQATAVRAMVPP